MGLSLLHSTRMSPGLTCLQAGHSHLLILPSETLKKRKYKRILVFLSLTIRGLMDAWGKTQSVAPTVSMSCRFSSHILGHAVVGFSQVLCTRNELKQDVERDVQSSALNNSGPWSFANQLSIVTFSMSHCSTPQFIAPRCNTVQHTQDRMLLSPFVTFIMRPLMCMRAFVNDVCVCGVWCVLHWVAVASICIYKHVYVYICIFIYIYICMFTCLQSTNTPSLTWANTVWCANQADGQSNNGQGW